MRMRHMAAAVLLLTEVAHATSAEVKARTQMRFLKQCDEQGIGRACYDYGYVLWKSGGRSQRKTARIYIHRGCELNYQTACTFFVKNNIVKEKRPPPDIPTDPNQAHGRCFRTSDLDSARFDPNLVNGGKVRGQKISSIKSDSFWSMAKLQENDVILRVNNMKFNSTRDLLSAFQVSGKKFAFQVQRESGFVVLWYSCQ